MDENIEKKVDTGSVSPSKSIHSWLENFWYHYKWHSIVALFLIFTITICSVQMCSKEKYDVHILYSGSYEIERTSQDGNFAEYETFLSSFKRAAGDYDGDGKISLSLKDLFIISNEEIEEIKKNDPDVEINRPLLMENQTVLNETLVFSNYYVCLLSAHVYDEYKVINDVQMFSPLSAYVKDGTSVEFYTDTAIYLSSTEFYSLPGICSLPEDTVICLRSISAIANHFNEKEAKEARERSIDVITNIINYSAN